ncbi:hypothetical protein FRB94_000989 [Tulasnella sp. JGI-2019a]|nr:hypothetical protein FRB94_000989 [Tulasnella sp. JGI-2019a]
MRPVNTYGFMAFLLPVLVQSVSVPVFLSDLFMCNGRDCDAREPTAPTRPPRPSNHPELLALSQKCSEEFTSPSLKARVGGKLSKDVIYTNNYVEELFLLWRDHAQPNLSDTSGRMKWVDVLWMNIIRSQEMDDIHHPALVNPVNIGAEPQVPSNFLTVPLPYRQIVQLREFIYPPHDTEHNRDPRKLDQRELEELWGDLMDEVGEYDSEYPNKVASLEVKKEIVGVSQSYPSKESWIERPFDAWRGLLSFNFASKDQQDFIQTNNIYSIYDFDYDNDAERYADDIIQTTLTPEQIEWFYWATYCTKSPMISASQDDQNSFRSLKLEDQLKIYQILKWREKNERRRSNSTR